MKPSSHRSQPALPCCANCKFAGRRRGIMGILCFLGDTDPDDRDEFCLLEEDELSQWWVARCTDETDVCDAFEAG